MKKKLKFIISLFLILIIGVSAFITPASSFQNDEVTSSVAMLLVNLDTRTIVYSKLADRPWFGSYQSELMTFLLMTEHVKDPQEVSVTVEQEFIDSLAHSDGCLEKYIGETLTLKDLSAIMLLTSGSDAAFLIADYVSHGNLDTFLRSMNKRADIMGCTETNFISPGYSESNKQLTSCIDLYRIYYRLVDNELYNEIMSSPTYIPERYGDDETYAVTTDNSILNPLSPYYFRYVTGGKFAVDPTAGASIVVTTSYKNMRYLFVALRGKNEAEENVFTDARRMTTWAYLNLSDRKVIDTDTPVDKVAVDSVWGQYEIDLFADNSARKTLPNEYEQNKFSVRMNVPKTLTLPLFKDEPVGDAMIYYDRERLDKVSIVSEHDEGVGLLSDLGRFGDDALNKMFPSLQAKAKKSALIVTEPATEAPTKAAKKQKAKEAPTEKATQATGAEE